MMKITIRFEKSEKNLEIQICGETDMHLDKEEWMAIWQNDKGISLCIPNTEYQNFQLLMAF